LSSPDLFDCFTCYLFLVVLAVVELDRASLYVLEREYALHPVRQAQLVRNFRKFHCGRDRYNMGK
jgi:hypothetical protein